MEGDQCRTSIEMKEKSALEKPNLDAEMKREDNEANCARNKTEISDLNGKMVKLSLKNRSLCSMR